MTALEAILLGIVQGITEFLPISSSGHLILGQKLLGLQKPEQYVSFDLFCHLGTLLAIFCLFFSSIRETVQSLPKLSQIILGSIPLIPIAFFHHSIRPLFSQTDYLGFFFLITAFVLFLSNRVKKETAVNILEKRKWRDSFLIGISQAIAILPGVSRSGMTLSTARLLGWNRNQAVQFSFLLGGVAIMGASLFEGSRLFLRGESSFLPLQCYLLGFASSFVVGYATLKLLMQLVIQEKLTFFAWYCTFLGLFTLFYFNI